MKTALWLYLFMFVAFFDLHAQYPILSPFALSLGAAPSFIGFILGMYSITHLPGNLIAGYGVDRFGSKFFIVTSLIVAGIVLIFQSRVTDPWQLLYIRSISGFVLAFLSPACLSMLAKIAKDRIHLGKLMAGNGFVHTMASVVSPAAGAFLVAKFGFNNSFAFLGWLLIITGILAIPFLKERKTSSVSGEMHLDPHAALSHSLLPSNARAPYSPVKSDSIPWLFFLVPLAISCSQGILFFELPMMGHSHGPSAVPHTNSILDSGIMFSLVSLGALSTLSLLFLHKFPAFFRTILGSLALALIFFGMAVKWPIPLYVSLFLIGMAKGIIFPALSTFLTSLTSANRYGRVFALLSISFSIGSFFGPVLAGQMRLYTSAYFLAFVVLMVALTFMPLRFLKAKYL